MFDSFEYSCIRSILIIGGGNGGGGDGGGGDGGCGGKGGRDGGKHESVKHVMQGFVAPLHGKG